MVRALKALGVIVGDRAAPLLHRRACAAALASAMAYVEPDEELSAALVGVAVGSIDDPACCETMAAAMMASGRSAPQLAASLRSLAVLAHARGELGTLAVLCRRLLGREEYAGCVDETLVRAAFERALGHDDPAKRDAGMTLDAWLGRVVAVPSWAADAVARHPEMLLSPRISVPHSVRLHAAAPTVVGWIALARLEERGRELRWSMAQFVGREDAAWVTLAAAVRAVEAAAEGPHTRRAGILRAWLHELTTDGQVREA